MAPMQGPLSLAFLHLRTHTLYTCFSYGSRVRLVDLRSNGGRAVKKVAIYLRVSTDSQTTENQRRELDAVATRSGWQVVRVYEDAGVSAPRAATSAPDSTP